MAYSGYEVADDGVIKTLEVYCRHLTEGGTFSATGTPDLAAIERYLDQTYYQIQAALAKEGYSTTITGTPALAILESLQAVGAAVKVELAHPITGFRGEPNERYIQFQRMWKEGVSLLATDALSVLGEARTTELGGFVEVGGISKSRKRTIADDTDAVPPRFRRGMFSNPLVGGQPGADADRYSS